MCKSYWPTLCLLCYLLGTLPLFPGVATADPKSAIVEPDPDKKNKRLSKKRRRSAWKKRQAWKKRRRKARLKRRWRNRRGRKQKARPVDTVEVRRAKGHNAAARELFMLGKYAEAAAEYKKAYKASPHPEFIYNIGQCYANLDTIKDLKWAVFYLNDYLKQSSEVVDAKDVKDELAAIKDQLRLLQEEQVQERRRAENDRLRSITSPDSPPSVEQKKLPVYKRWWFWGMIGALAGGTAAAIVVLQSPAQEPVMGTMEPGQIQMP